jgi:uncharacterized protein
MTTSSRADEADRLHVLDVLRGIALLGMFLVHFNIFSSGGNRADQIYQSAVTLLLEERFWAIFAMLFGVGFAIQMRRADARGDSVVGSFLRRMAVLAVFGFAAHAFFGFNVLLGYAVWGVPLLFVRRWSVRALVVATAISAATWSIYNVATTVYRVATYGQEATRAAAMSTLARNREFRQANDKAQDATSYRAVLRARLEHMRWFYAQPFSFLPVNNFTLFLLGLLGLRLGLFDAPTRHRRLIASIALFGIASWVIATFVFPLLPVPGPTAPFLRTVIVARLIYGLGLIREMWLAFAYIGVVLLLVAHNRDWIRRLGLFAWTGRMALTNYMIQVALLDFMFAKYALGLVVTPLVGLTMAVALFLADALVSRWWLSRFRYGPLEWLWRSATYARWQPWRVQPRSPVVAEEMAAAR